MNYLGYSRFYGRAFLFSLFLFGFFLCYSFLWECLFFSLFLFHFISFAFFTLYLSFSFLLSLFVLFNLGGSFVLVRVKQVVGFHRVFILKIRGGGVRTVGNAITKNEVNISGPLGFTALPERSNTGYVEDYEG